MGRFAVGIVIVVMRAMGIGTRIGDLCEKTAVPALMGTKINPMRLPRHETGRYHGPQAQRQGQQQNQ